MRLDSVLDSFYVLSSLWGALTGAPVCTSTASSLPTVTFDLARSPLSTGVTAFVDVHVVPMDRERVLPNQTVLVENGRVTALGPSGKVQVPAGAVRIDGRGKYLMPGFADMHAHLLLGEDSVEAARRLSAYLANGVTTLRQAFAFNGRTAQTLKHFATAEVLGPRLYLAPGITWSKKNGLTPPLDSLAAYVAAAKAQGYAFIAIPPGAEDKPSSEQRAAIDSLLAIARRAGLPVSSHAHRAAFEQMLALGAYGGSVEHLYAFRDTLGRQDTDISAAKLRALAGATQRAGTWVTVTLTCYIRADRGPSLPVARQLVKALQDAGVKLLLGADLDIPSWRSPSIVHTEFAELVRAGLTPYQALVTGTRNPAQYLGMLDSAGTVAVGKRADLVLLQDNPLADIRHTRELAGVMLGGRWLDRTTLDQGLLADLRYWFKVAIKGNGVSWGANGRFGEHTVHFETLIDSLAAATPAAQEGVRRQLAEELGEMRAALTPEQQETFDPTVRAWLREQARQGSRVAVSGVSLILKE